MFNAILLSIVLLIVFLIGCDAGKLAAQGKTRGEILHELTGRVITGIANFCRFVGSRTKESIGRF